MNSSSTQRRHDVLCFRRWLLATTVFCLSLDVVCPRWVKAESVAAIAQEISELDADVLPASQREEVQNALPLFLNRRVQQANERSRRAWSLIDDREAWEQFRASRMEALRRSLGLFRPAADEIHFHLTGEIRGDGFFIENVLFESRPGLWVTANLYLPAEPTDDMPGILICHSHHAPKEHGELQDMGMTWARSGCAVLVMDQLGHGERRQHPFRTAEDYTGDFRLSRQDYYFRYDTSIQLHLVGESLIGWMVWDLMRGVDFLLSWPGVDPNKIILLGAVAGGGDPAAVAAALDERIVAAVPFNFGGPQPETRYPLPEDAEISFNFAGGGSWESTRNLRRSAADGFLPWVIVGGIAPRRLIYAHEFNWDRPRDPVWQRLERIYELYDSKGHLGFTHGHGLLRGQPPEATHCTHIGSAHRVMIHAALEEWFDIRVTPEDEYSNRVPAERLTCWKGEILRETQAKSLSEMLVELADKRMAAQRLRLQELPPQVRQHLGEAWGELLGKTMTDGPPVVEHSTPRQSLSSGVSVDRFALETDSGIPVPVLLLVPKGQPDKAFPVVVAVAQSGKSGFLAGRSHEISELLAGGVAVCLPDLRGTGETRVGESRDRQSSDTSLSSTALMLGETMVGGRLRDLRAVIQYLRRREGIDSGRIAIWGNSFAVPNPSNDPEDRFRVPHAVSGRPHQSEPLGGLVALLCGLYDDDLAAIYVQGGLVGIKPILTSPFVHIPHDVVIPGALTASELCDIAAALAPLPLRFQELVDHRNVVLSPDRIREAYAPAVRAYQIAGHVDALSFAETSASPSQWLMDTLSR